MVKVWYEPPPGGPRTNLNRGAYYIENATTPDIIKRMTKMRGVSVVVPAVATIVALCYIPLMSPKNLPGTLSAEHLAAQRAYMRYHNMNPMFGTSSKQSRAADPDP
mmetsp:Transcript_69037/g.95941  ORF Transcript_69037/g.95941 Transcript_69037/m.95941 type:complete len:106 (-) Transcript_69037:101-418(-)